LRKAVQTALGIPESEQRLIYAGTQLAEEFVTPEWRQRRSTGALAVALGLDKIPDGTPLTLEHYGIQKNSVINVVRKVMASPNSAACCGPAEDSASPGAQPMGSDVMGVTQAVRPSTASPPGAAGTSGIAAELAPQLASLNDLELLVLLRPLLRQRPTLRAALLAEESGPGRGYAASSTAAAVPEVVAYEPGDLVSVWSNSAQKWFEGEVLNMAFEGTSKIPQGSLEVSFELGRKWIAPADISKALKRR